MKDLHQNSRSSDVKNGYYRTWSLYILSLLRPLYQGLFGLALPNYLIYQGILNEEIIGIIIGTTALIYIISPFLGQFLSRFIGNRCTIIISTILSGISLLFQVIFFKSGAWLLIVMQVIEGIALGCFWPNVMNQISIWQNISTEKQNHRNFRNFNLSWNIGLLSGFILGFIVVGFFNNDFIAMIFSVTLVLISILLAFFIEDENKFQDRKYNSLGAESKEKLLLIEDNGQDILFSTETKKINKFPHLFFPALIAWSLSLYYCTAKSIYNFVLPFSLLNLGIGSAWRYLITFCQQLLQIFGLYYIGEKKISFKDKIIRVTLIFDIFFAIMMVLFSNIIVLISGVIFIGISTGLKQGVVMRINFDHSSVKKNQKYITYGEISAGIGFGVTPLWMGWIIQVNSQIIFFVLVGFSLTINILYFWLIRQKPNE